MGRSRESAGGASPRLLLLDGHSLAFRAFYALPVENFTAVGGQPTNAVFGFTSMLLNLLRDEQPTHVGVAFDVSRETFRRKEFPEYKATRSSTPEEFRGQVDLIKDVLGALGIEVVEREGFEADDCLATLATQARDRGFETLIVTGDRDAFQLVEPSVTVLYPRRGVSDLARMTPDAVEEKYGLSPGQYADYAALRGDPSDNLPGIPGVGEKTAAKWIREYGSLQGLVDSADQVGGKVGSALRECLPQVLVNRRLTELVRDVPLGVTPDGLERHPVERRPVEEVFEALSFRVLRDRLGDVVGPSGSVIATATAGAGGDPAPVPDEIAPAGWPGWLAEHAAGRTAVAFAGSWGAGTGRLDAIALLGRDGHAAIAAPDEPSVLAWLADDARPKAVHEAKGPTLALLAAGGDLAGVEIDTALAAYLVLPGLRDLSLPAVAERLLGRPLAGAGEAQGQLALDDGGGDSIDADRLIAEARAIADLADVLPAEVAQRGAADLLRDVEQPLTRVLAGMEALGIHADAEGLAALSTSFAEGAAEQERIAHDLVGHPVNLGSPKQLQEVLFVERGLPKTKRIKTGYTTDAEALQSLYVKTGDPLLHAILGWRDWSRLRQTVDGLRPLIAADGRIHTTFHQAVTATGRLSSSDPNLQNIPIRTEEGRRIRECFTVGPGHAALLTADYSQIEMRIMAHLSGDTGLIAAFTEGEDLHTTVAAHVFGVAGEEVDPEMRRRIKAMSYGLAYGLSAFGLSQQLGIEPDEARALMDDYFDRFGGVRDYLAGIVEQARETGYTETILGRRRYLPDLASDNRQRREMAERMALNAPIQGSAADIIKVAMLSVDRALRERSLDSRLLLQVHDELVLEVSAGEEAEVRDLVVVAMGGAADLRVPLEVSIGIGETWAAAGH